MNDQILLHVNEKRCPNNTFFECTEKLYKTFTEKYEDVFPKLRKFLLEEKLSYPPSKIIFHELVKRFQIEGNFLY